MERFLNNNFRKILQFEQFVTNFLQFHKLFLP